MVGLFISMAYLFVFFLHMPFCGHLSNGFENMYTLTLLADTKNQ